MCDFTNGELLKTLYVDYETTYMVGQNSVTSIIVAMENGQMASVPWFEVWTGNILSAKYNGAKILGVEYT